MGTMGKNEVSISSAFISQQQQYENHHSKTMYTRLTWLSPALRSRDVSVY